MSWIFFAGLGYFLTALSILGDKFILRKVLPKPASYAFFQGVLSLGVVVLIPFGFSILGWREIIISFLAGGFFLYALFFFFHALRLADASRVQPIILSLTPLILFVLERYGLDTLLGTKEIFSAILLVLGSVVLSLDFEHKERAGYKIFILYSLLAAILFALSSFLLKGLFFRENFFNVLIWSRFGIFLGAGSLLFFNSARKSIFSSSKVIRRPKATGGIISNKIIGAIGFFFLSLALSRGPATLVNALQGLQYAFLFIIAWVFSIFLPGVIKENLRGKALAQKISGIILVSLGIFLLAFSGNGQV